MSKTSHAAFFGDAEHVFDLAPSHIVRELEAATGAGIGALVRRVIEERTFHHADVEHTIRLGLIGGGMSPKEAARLVAAYLPAAPLEEGMLLAMSVLGSLFFGTSREELPVEEAPAPVEELPAPEAPAVDIWNAPPRRRAPLTEEAGA
ncbi:MAG: gene transfer agent family protein [Methylorubrum populi]